MNELIIHIQNLLARSGAPAWLQKPSAWLALASSLALIVMLVRMLFKRSREAQVAPAPAPQAPRRQQATGVFGAWTEAFASQIPESEKERKEFGAVLKQAGMYSPTARASVYAYRFLLLAFPLLSS
jgi:hypothetical protein